MTDEDTKEGETRHLKLRKEVAEALGLSERDSRVGAEVALLEIREHIKLEYDRAHRRKPRGTPVVIQPLNDGLSADARLEKQRQELIDEMVNRGLNDAGISRAEILKGFTHSKRIRIGVLKAKTTHVWEPGNLRSTTTITIDHPDGRRDESFRSIDFANDSRLFGSTHIAADGTKTTTSEQTPVFDPAAGRSGLAKIFGVFELSNTSVIDDSVHRTWTGPDGETKVETWGDAASNDGSVVTHTVVYDDLGVIYSSETRTTADGASKTTSTTPGTTSTVDSTNTTDADTDDDPTDDDDEAEPIDAEAGTATAITTGEETTSIDTNWINRPTRRQMLGKSAPEDGTLLMVLDSEGRPVLRAKPVGGATDPNPEAEIVLLRRPTRKPAAAGPEFGANGPQVPDFTNVHPPTIGPMARRSPP